jgi:hypothetical protein
MLNNPCLALLLSHTSGPPALDPYVVCVPKRAIGSLMRRQTTPPRVHDEPGLASQLTRTVVAGRGRHR